MHPPTPTNHIVIKVSASKLTTHEPSDFDETYTEWIKGQIEQKLRDMKFHRMSVEVRVQPSWQT